MENYEDYGGLIVNKFRGLKLNHVVVDMMKYSKIKFG